MKIDSKQFYILENHTKLEANIFFLNMAVMY